MAVVENEDDVDSLICIPGLGENKPKPHQFRSALFVYVPDPYSTKSVELPSEIKESQEISSPTSGEEKVEAVSCLAHEPIKRKSISERDAEIDELPSELALMNEPNLDGQEPEQIFLGQWLPPNDMSVTTPSVQINEVLFPKPCVRIIHPPGGPSCGSFW